MNGLDFLAEKIGRKLMVTRRNFLKQIGMAVAGGAMFAAGATQVKEPCKGGITSEPEARKLAWRMQCQTCRMPKCASTVKIDVQTIDLKQLCEMLDANKQGIKEIIQTGNLNGRKVFYKVDHKMGPSRIPLGPIS